MEGLVLVLIPLFGLALWALIAGFRKLYGTPLKGKSHEH